jgi:hypothetical protein
MPGKFSAFSPSILFGQVQEIIDLGRKRPLEFDDLPELPPATDPRVGNSAFRELNLQSSGSFLRSIMGEVKGSIEKSASTPTIP